MEQDINKKIEQWYEKIGEEEFLRINNEISSVIDKLELLLPDDVFLGTIEGELVQVSAGIIGEQEFLEDINKELMLLETTENITKQISEVVNNFFKKNTAQEKINPSTEVNENNKTLTPSEMVTRLNEKMTKPTFIVPTKRDYSDHSLKDINQTEPPQGIKSIDPYREIPRDDK